MTENNNSTKSISELWTELTTQGEISSWQPAAPERSKKLAKSSRVIEDEMAQVETLPASLREACDLYVQGNFLQVRRKLQRLPNKSDRTGFLGRLLKLLALLRVQQGQKQIPRAALQRIWDEGKQLRHEDAALDELLEWLWHFCHRHEEMPAEFWEHAPLE